MNLLRDLAMPPDQAARDAAWVRAEAEGDDLALVALRELEQACTGLPAVVDGSRRTRLLAADAIATTWEAWRSDDGTRVLLRCLQPRWLLDPVMRRRFGASASGTEARLRLDGDWPHFVLPCPGTPVLDHLPVEDPPSTLVLARLLGAGLEALLALHKAGRVHGGPIGPLLVDGPSGAHLAWLDGLCPGRQPADDLRALSAVIATLDPQGIDPIGQLARSWAVDPPPGAADALSVVQATLAGVLLDHRHALAMASRRVGRRDRATRLAAAARALSATLKPPTGQACLRASLDGLFTLVHSDGHTVRGGVGAQIGPTPLPLVWTADAGLNPQAARSLMRAWATRGQGDEPARQAEQARLDSDDQTADQLVRWLRAVAGLRRARLLLEHQTRQGRVGPRSASPLQSSATVTR